MKNKFKALPLLALVIGVVFVSGCTTPFGSGDTGDPNLGERQEGVVQYNLSKAEALSTCKTVCYDKYETSSPNVYECGNNECICRC